MSSHFLTDKSLNLEARFYGTAVRRLSAFGEPGQASRFGPDRGFELCHVELTLDLDLENQSLTGESILHIAPLDTGMGTVTLDLGDVELIEVRHGEGHALTWRREDRKLHIDGVPAHGGALHFRYKGRPGRGLYFPGPTPAFPDRDRMVWSQCQDEDGHHLFPCIDHPSIKCTWKIDVIVDSSLTVVSNGRLIDTQPAEAGRTRWSWAQERPIPPYLVTIVAGDFEILEAVDAPVPVRYLAPRGTSQEVLHRVFHKTPEMIRWMSERLGVDYPWPRYDQVVVWDFIFGGMENVAATTLTELSLTDERAALDWNAEDLILHELAHQWFGDLVTCSDWSQAWLNEGWATYSEHLWRCHDLSQEDGDHGLFTQLGNYLREASSRYRRPIVHFGYRSPIDLFDRHLYEKGALVLHTLRHTLGDEIFFAGTTRYLKTHAEGSVHTLDFQRAMEQTSGRNLDRFFQQWIHGAGHPNLTVSLSHSAGMLQVAVKQTQQGPQVEEAFELALRIRIHQGDQSHVITLPVDTRERAWALPCAEAPERVEVDADFRLLAHIQVDASVELLRASLQGDASVVGRIRAARGLAKKGSSSAQNALIDALSEADFWGVRAEIAGLLATWGGERSRCALLEACGDPHPKSRRAIVAALGAFRHPDVHARLSDIVRDGDPSIQVEGEAGRSLGRSRGPELVSACRALLERESWGAILQVRALEGLGVSRQAQVLDLLLEWTQPTRHPRAQAAAAAALGTLADSVPGVREAVLPRLIEMARDGAFRVRLSAIGALGQARLSGAVGVLQRIHASDEDGRVQRMSFEALEKIQSGRTGEDALAGLKAELEKLRRQNQELQSRVDKLEDKSED
jgi:aminopeptidase N